MNWLMGVDMGTSGCKAVVFDEKFNVRAQAYREYPMHFPGEGLLELDAELVWAGIQEAVKEANSLSEQPVAALAVSAIGDVIIPVDEKGDSVRYSIVDFDPRGGDEIAAFTEKFGVQRFFDLNGMPPIYIGSLAKILYLKEKEPEVFAKTKRLFLFEDYIAYMLSGERGISPSLASRTAFYDVDRADWSHEILNAFGIDPSLLSPVRDSGSVLGKLRQDMARKLGLPEELEVFVGCHDQCAALLGGGAVKEGDVVSGQGSTESYNILTKNENAWKFISQFTR